MTTVILVVHVMICIALVVVVLLQRSDGGALGIGGGGDGFVTGRSAGNALTRATAILGACFFVTSLALTVLASYQNKSPIMPGTTSPLSGSAPAGNNHQLPAKLPTAPETQTTPSAPQASTSPSASGASSTPAAPSSSAPSAPETPAAPEPPKSQ